VHPRNRRLGKSPFLGNCEDMGSGRSYLGSLACVLRATTKRSSTFSGKKNAQNPGYAYTQLESDVDRVELFRLTLRFFDDVSTASLFIYFLIP